MKGDLMASAVVTGASGFIGRYLVEELLAAGYDVVAAVHSEASAQSLGAELPSVRTAVCDQSDWSPIAAQCEEALCYFFHLAWGGFAKRGTEGTDAQVASIAGSVAALRFAKRLGCERFVGAGSIHELEGLADLAHSAPSSTPTNRYKAAKLAAHHLCKVEASECEIDFLWPRITNAYGPRESSLRLINSMIRKLLAGESPDLTDGWQLYTFVYAADVARAFRLIAERGESFADYVIGSEEVAPLRTWLERLGRVVAPEIELGFGRLPRGVRLDSTGLYTEALFTDTGFRIETSFEEGIRRTAEWIGNNG